MKNEHIEVIKDPVSMKDYIKKVLKSFQPGCEVEFTVHLNPDVTVSDSPTGNTVRFTVIKCED